MVNSLCASTVAVIVEHYQLLFLLSCMVLFLYNNDYLHPMTISIVSYVNISPTCVCASSSTLVYELLVVHTHTSTLVYELLVVHTHTSTLVYEFSTLFVCPAYCFKEVHGIAPYAKK
eukprot:GHVR01103370.1.p1 GENE.GHVR01103370.1~~GHVR01103370.1.p1  ORF type:complete len:117 (-),score=26.67 GHVR01103370.1:247-597(-)